MPSSLSTWRAPPSTLMPVTTRSNKSVGGGATLDRKRTLVTMARSSSSSSSSSSSPDGNNQTPHSPTNGSGGGSSGHSAGSTGRPRRRKPGVFEVLVSTPPPRSLGLHSLPPDTHNGDRIEIDDKPFVVRRLVLRYRLERGRYVRDAQALEVASQGRYLVDQFLDQLVEK